MFQLHSRLASDSVLIGEFDLSLVLLSKDANYPWVILVPKCEGISEIHHLTVDDQHQLMLESCRTAKAMVALFAPDKMNVASLGNLVPQLHVHHVARYQQDCAWPGPVWGAKPAQAYSEDALLKRLTELREQLSGDGFVSLG